ncbi:hypothetical protein Ae505Ps2_3272 [Pseudonocardia sp. Ae505_Ps2]|nr:hypothetical protein Ae505Ps2_3272 [Pseudonocardia sp. Ae505_Ps2]
MLPGTYAAPWHLRGVADRARTVGMGLGVRYRLRRASGHPRDW